MITHVFEAVEFALEVAELEIQIVAARAVQPCNEKTAKSSNKEATSGLKLQWTNLCHRRRRACGRSAPVVNASSTQHSERNDEEGADTEKRREG